MTVKANSFGKRAAAMSTTMPVSAPVMLEEPEKESTPPGFLTRLPWVTGALCGALIVRFITELRAATDWITSGQPGHFTLLALGGSSRDLVLNSGEWWRLFTATALHGSPSHLIGNLVALAAAGILLEPIIGAGWFAAIYFTGALLGAIFSMMLNPADMISVGASGAIMACCAATFCLSFHDGTARPGLMRRVAGGLLFPALAPAVADGGAIVDIGAHFGGAVAGTLVAFVILISWPDRTDRLPGGGFAAILGGSLFAMTVAAFLISATRFDQYAVKGNDYIPAAEIPKDGRQMKEKSLALADKYPKDPRAHFFRGLYFLDNNNLHDAEPRLREAIRLGEVNKNIMSPYFLDWAKTALAVDLSGLNRRQEALAIAAPLCANRALGQELRGYLNSEGLCPS